MDRSRRIERHADARDEGRVAVASGRAFRGRHRLHFLGGEVVGKGAARPVGQHARADRGGRLRRVAREGERDVAPGAVELAFEQERLARFGHAGEARQDRPAAIEPFRQRGQRPALGRIVGERAAEEIVEIDRRIVLARERVPVAHLDAPLDHGRIVGIRHRPSAHRERQRGRAQRIDVVGRRTRTAAVGIADRELERLELRGLARTGRTGGARADDQLRLAEIVPEHVVGPDRAVRHAAAHVFGQHMRDGSDEIAHQHARVERLHRRVAAQQRRAGRRFVDHRVAARAVGPFDGPVLEKLGGPHMAQPLDLRAGRRARELLGPCDEGGACRVGLGLVDGDERLGGRRGEIHHRLAGTDLEAVPEHDVARRRYRRARGRVFPAFGHSLAGCVQFGCHVARTICAGRRRLSGVFRRLYPNSCVNWQPSQGACRPRRRFPRPRCRAISKDRAGPARAR